MGKHEKIEEEQLYKNLNNELRSARNIKEISLITHLYIEYYFRELIFVKFKLPENIINNSFNSKFNILVSTGILEQDLIENIKVIQKIRNHYAHNIIIEKNIYRNIEEKIRKMHFIIGPTISDEKGDILSIEDIQKDELKFEFGLHCLGVIIALNNLLNKEEKENLNKIKR